MSEQKLQNEVVAGEVPSQATFSLVLSHLYKGDKPVIANANCVFSYSWNFDTNMGLAQLVSIDNCDVNITLHPLGIQGYLDFMSDMAPTSVVINGQRVVLNRIILNIQLATNKRSGGIMFNENGDIIQTTDNFVNAKASF
ncbi:hypothetical protein LZZ90_02860 [Flavobacterium sp. SM15]|uniref:hypothetical protein n=1 Tax=Flavobacterium sp. SM15 TaxID=2908005 RepID=UPI001EDA3C11|nr:hypothetical protein [Flavobacterium sp. SM15]MCG2610447.1 hypothetical protein [Flavobacterium sp. SM15]